MSLEDELRARSGDACELCGNAEGLAAFAVAPHEDTEVAHHVMLCATCRGQVEDVGSADGHHWRCLNDSMWSQVPAVQVMAWRLLSRLSPTQLWCADLLEQLYLDEETLEWAKAATGGDAADALVHKDAHGAVLSAGDTVTLIKDLNVKGGGFTAKRGTAVRNIALVQDNPEHIEGRVSGQQIVILTKFVKRSA